MAREEADDDDNATVDGMLQVLCYLHGLLTRLGRSREQLTWCMLADSDAPMLASPNMYDCDLLDALDVIEQAAEDDGLTPAQVGDR